MTHTASDKYREALREVRMRQQVYPNLVDKRGLTQAEADRRITIMKAIAEDYRAAAEKEETPLLSGLEVGVAGANSTRR